MPARFLDRSQAGRELARALEVNRDRSDALVLALPRGGIPIGAEVAQELHLPLDVFVVRKLGVPGHEELAMGAIASNGVRVLDRELIHSLRISEDSIAQVCERELAEVARREQCYRVFPPKPIAGKAVILVDDGLATGSTMLAAIRAVRQHKPVSVTVAVPVAAAETAALFRSIADEFIVLYIPEQFRSVGMWYEDFTQITDDQVRSLLWETDRVNAG